MPVLEHERRRLVSVNPRHNTTVDCHNIRLGVRFAHLLPSSTLDSSRGEGVRMEDSMFDRLARTVGTGGSRRRLLGVLTGLGLGSALTVLEAGDAGAEKPQDRL